MNQRRVEEGKEVDMWLGLRVIDAGVDKGGEKRSTRWGERGIDTHTDTEGENAEELGKQGFRDGVGGIRPSKDRVGERVGGGDDQGGKEFQVGQARAAELEERAEWEGSEDVCEVTVTVVVVVVVVTVVVVVVVVVLVVVVAAACQGYDVIFWHLTCSRVHGP